MKKRITLFLIPMMLLSLVVLPNFIGADTYDYGFSGTVDYWGGNVDTNAKKTVNDVPYLQWDGGDTGDKGTEIDYNIWFSVRTTNNATLRKVLFYADDVGIGYKIGNCDTKVGSSYNLFANREHVLNNRKFVEGTWQP